MSGNSQKFINKKITAKGEDRGYVDLKEYNNLWFNTGTLCNLACENCYIESSPTNDRLSFINLQDVIPFLDEIKKDNLPIDTISFTGGEPFINPHMIKIITEVLDRELSVLVLTNAHKILKRWEKDLLSLRSKHGDKLKVRVSLDHYTKEIHNQERGPKAFENALNGITWLHNNNFNLHIAGRSLTDESYDQAFKGYQELFLNQGIKLDLSKENLVIFPEMIPNEDVPEITTECWNILKKSPDTLMCAKERMVVKVKGKSRPQVQACTLLAYDENFNLGSTLREARKRVYLNHSFCAKFCVLGGASCSG